MYGVDLWGVDCIVLELVYMHMQFIGGGVNEKSFPLFVWLINCTFSANMDSIFLSQ